MRFLISNRYLLLFILSVFLFFAPLFLLAKLPIPSDDLIGLYHPWRDSFGENYPNGIPFKNPLITDPIRQQYPYRYLAIESLKKGEFPGWNPYVFAGTPLFANIQTAVFNPFNLLFLFVRFEYAWSLLVMFQPLFAGFFLYYYLKELHLDKRACLLGAASFSFSGFMIAWLTWNTLGQVALWLPLILLAKEKLLKKITVRWIFILLLAETSIWVSGHLQTAFYAFIFSTVYLLIRLFQLVKNKSKLTVPAIRTFIVTGIAVLLIISAQLIPTFNFIFRSARNFDLPDWQREDWFLPPQHLVQFIVPDFFGNPATGNYSGVWNYGEFVSYVGVIPFIFALFALLARRDKKTFFFAFIALFALLLALPTPLGKLPYELGIPFLSTIQPSRIIFIVDFCLSILAALGFDYFFKKYRERYISQVFKESIFSGICIGVIFLVIWVGLSKFANAETAKFVLVAKRNLLLPIFSVLVYFGFILFARIIKRKILFEALVLVFLLFILADQLRFAQKFTPFTHRDYLFPQTSTIDFLKHNLGFYRYMTTDRRIFPANVSTVYALQTVDGYDPLYLLTYGQMIAAWTRNAPSSAPAQFNSILTPEDYRTFMTNLFGVKYILSFTEIADPQFNLVFKEGETKVYENTKVFPRAFLLESVEQVETHEEELTKLFSEQTTLNKKGFTTYPVSFEGGPLELQESATIEEYSANYIRIRTHTVAKRLLVLTDPYYDSWEAFFDGNKRGIIPVDFIFRGVIVEPGDHEIEFRYSPIRLAY